MQSDIRYLHEADLAIAKEVVSICEKYGLRYYMLGGTMLGAIRHKGFIPWDDDMDLGMPRKDYERFLEVAPKELPSMMKIINYKTDKDYHYYITRIQDLETKVVETRYEHEGGETCASIDLFPLDGSPNNFLLRKMFYFRVMAHRAMMALHYKNGIDPDRKRGIWERLAISLLTMLPTEKMFDAYRQKQKIDYILKKYDMATSKVSGNIMGAYRIKEMVPTEWYGDGAFYSFENLKLHGLKEYDKYLSHLYGDYMSVPPVDSRKVHFKIVEIHGKKVEE
ncbi:LicD family protein [Paraprevotella xylaniphila]|uniref:LicD family protein n=1 Tax=Paraprevotella xylaniphila TaxID=454155 RepID=UPI003AB14BA7